MDEAYAVKLFSMIPSGHENPLLRTALPIVDRKFRRMVEEANRSGDCIINVGKGYYRPVPGDPVDEKEFREYMNKELARARKILSKRMKMRTAFEKRRDYEVFADHTRQA